MSLAFQYHAGDEFPDVRAALLESGYVVVEDVGSFIELARKVGEPKYYNGSR